MMLTIASMDLFDQDQERDTDLGAPLADRMRPRSLDEFVGQEKVLGPGTPLRRMIEKDNLTSLILWGPPGTGKTTLAKLVAKTTRARFVPFSAVLGGVKEVRAIVQEAKRQRQAASRRTVLFVDEIHRFNKAQQDAFLPHVEDGTLILIGATTENPSFEVNSALLSRCRVITFEHLATTHLVEIMQNALADAERGLGRLAVTFEPEALELIAERSRGDARQALSTLEAIAHHFESTDGDQIVVNKESAGRALLHSPLLYDKSGEEHYNVVSAFIKSMRGSDPDAAVYWMVRMLEAGEDPLFLLRRMVIFASEDVGNADPDALAVAVHALESFRFVGLPEGVLPMTQAATYLACAPKSNSALKAYGRARKDVLDKGPLQVPSRLRNAPTKLMKGLGYGRDYKYPHDFDGAYVPESYMPEGLEHSRYYEPSDRGREAEIKQRLEEWNKQRKRTDGGE